MKKHTIYSFFLALILYIPIIFTLFWILSNVQFKQKTQTNKKVKIDLKQLHIKDNPKMENKKTKVIKKQPIKKEVVKKEVTKIKDKTVKKIKKTTTKSSEIKKKESIKKQIKSKVKNEVIKDKTIAKKKVIKKEVIKKEVIKKEVNKKEPIKNNVKDKPIDQKTQSNKVIPKKEMKKKLKQNIENEGLYNALLNAPTKKFEQTNNNHRTSLFGKTIQEIYGDIFKTLSDAQKEYIQTKQGSIQAITQTVLNRIGVAKIPYGLKFQGRNIIEFTLYPDGHISQIKMLKESGFFLLDDITKQTIQIAYKDYPYPYEPTLIRFYVIYDLGGY